ncbi:MAG: protein kinase domain-containing protein, partial [Microcoleaceae cyanobacterium]
MLPAIPLGTTLQNRYRLLSILGQGGFGRTYLAEDLGRFNERCALKEFIPQTNNPYAIAKSKELFTREASALYQIQHPQIPQFRAIFEENQRLFILQDYVEGKTYHTILDERKASGDKFTELEVLNFNKQLLPVLSYLHSRNMIHRDISPDNIILRDTDQMPVLIDFGVVKELVTQATTGTTTAAATATTVGKVGFSPPEQMQTGKVNPNSDFYALAVTSLVMLTGKDPSELLDQVNLTWDWQKWASVSPGFATILDKMLSHKPGDRYQSANEILQAINQLGGNNPTVTSVPPTVNTNTPPVQPDNSSSIGTVVVGRRPNPNQNIDLEEPDQDNDGVVSFWDSKAAIVGVSSLVVILLGLGSWALVSSILKSFRKKSEDQKPELVSPSPSPS